MALPFKLPWQAAGDRKPRLGRLSPVDVEVSDSVGDWYYFGRVEMWEKEFEFNDEPLEQTFHCKRCEKDFTLPSGSKHCTVRGGFIASTTSKPDKPQKHMMYFYRLLTNFREDEKIIVSHRDFIHNANQIPYTQTRRGRNRMFQVIMIAFGMVYALTLYVMALFVQAGPSIVYYTQQVSGLELDVGNIAFVFVAGAVIWAWAARYHHMVSDWEIQPLRVNSVRVSTDFYLLTNSSKMPVFETVLELAKAPQPEIDRMVAAAREFPAQEIHRLQGRVEFLEDSLEETELDAIDAWQDAREGGMITRNKRVAMKQDTQKWVTITVVVAILAVLVTVVTMAGV